MKRATPSLQPEGVRLRLAEPGETVDPVATLEHAGGVVSGLLMSGTCPGAIEYLSIAVRALAIAHSCYQEKAQKKGVRRER